MDDYVSPANANAWSDFKQNASELALQTKTDFASVIDTYVLFNKDNA